jgi:hypothetical protein
MKISGLTSNRGARVRGKRRPDFKLNLCVERYLKPIRAYSNATKSAAQGNVDN